MSDTITRRLPALALCIASALALAACGGNGIIDDIKMVIEPAEDRYGSIAMHIGLNGGASLEPGGSRTAARNSALASCRENHSNCQEVLWFRNACGALAYSADGSRAGAGWGEHGIHAEFMANTRCRAAGGENCSVTHSIECYTGGSSPAAGGASTIPALTAGSPVDPPPGENGNNDPPPGENGNNNPPPEEEQKRYVAAATEVSNLDRGQVPRMAIGFGQSESEAEREARSECGRLAGSTCLTDLAGQTDICYAVAGPLLASISSEHYVELGYGTSPLPNPLTEGSYDSALEAARRDAVGNCVRHNSDHPGVRCAILRDNERGSAIAQCTSSRP